MHVAADACLENPIVVQKILKHHSPNSMENLELRLINTLFNTEMLHRIRRTHGKIRIELLKDIKFKFHGRTSDAVRVVNIYVNYLDVKTERIFEYLEFLKKVANVKMEHFVIEDLWATVISGQLSDEWRKRLHDVIHTLLENQYLKTFVGMSDLCDGFCEKCYHLAASSSEYGPLQIGITSDSFRNKRHLHFEKLIVSERHLHGIASNMFMYVPEDRKQFLEYYVDPLISCDKLCFKISEVHDEFKGRLTTQPLPLEIIEEMCDVWKAKSIEIECDYGPQRAETWSENGIITPLRFDELYQQTDSDSDKKKKKKREFSSVTIDMQNTRKIYSEVINGSIDQNESYSNLIENVRRVFPTDEIIIISPGWPLHGGLLFFSQDRLVNILKSVWNNPGHMEVTIRHHSPLLGHRDDFVIPDSIDILGRRLTCTLLPGRLYYLGYTRRIFRITDEIGEKTLNLELFLGSSMLEYCVNDPESGNKTLLEKGFINLFYKL